MHAWRHRLARFFRRCACANETFVVDMRSRTKVPLAPTRARPDILSAGEEGLIRHLHLDPGRGRPGRGTCQKRAKDAEQGQVCELQIHPVPGDVERNCKKGVGSEVGCESWWGWVVHGWLRCPRERLFEHLPPARRRCPLCTKANCNLSTQKDWLYMESTFYQPF